MLTMRSLEMYQSIVLHKRSGAIAQQQMFSLTMHNLVKKKAGDLKFVISESPPDGEKVVQNRC